MTKPWLKACFILILLEKSTFWYKNYEVLKGGWDETVQGDDEALNGNGEALNVNGKALKCVGEALKNTLFSQK